MNYQKVIGKDITPEAKITSALVSLIILGFLAFGPIPKKLIIYAFGFLAFHLINNIYVGFWELKIPTCSKCGQRLKFKKIYEKHKCKK